MAARRPRALADDEVWVDCAAARRLYDEAKQQIRGLNKTLNEKGFGSGPLSRIRGLEKPRGTRGGVPKATTKMKRGSVKLFADTCQIPIDQLLFDGTGRPATVSEIDWSDDSLENLTHDDLRKIIGTEFNIISETLGLNRGWLVQVLREEISAALKANVVSEAALRDVLKKIGKGNVPVDRIVEQLHAMADELLRFQSEYGVLLQIDHAVEGELWKDVNDVEIIQSPFYAATQSQLAPGSAFGNDVSAAEILQSQDGTVPQSQLDIRVAFLKAAGAVKIGHELNVSGVGVSRDMSISASVKLRVEVHVQMKNSGEAQVSMEGRAYVDFTITFGSFFSISGSATYASNKSFDVNVKRVSLGSQMKFLEGISNKDINRIIALPNMSAKKP